MTKNHANDNKHNTDVIDEESQSIDWKKLYDLLTQKFHSLENDFQENQHALMRVKNEEAKKGKEEALNKVLLPLYDDLETLFTEMSNGCELSVLCDAIKLIKKNSYSLLSQIKLEKIESSEGTLFNPKLHDAFSVNTSKLIEKDQIIKEMRSGYTLDGTMFRPARVIVSSGNG